MLIKTTTITTAIKMKPGTMNIKWFIYSYIHMYLYACICINVEYCFVVCMTNKFITNLWYNFLSPTIHTMPHSHTHMHTHTYVCGHLYATV